MTPESRDRDDHIRPSTWLPARRFALSLVRPIERFLHIQAASGIVLLAAAIVAMIWANSPWAHSYEALWELSFGIDVGGFRFEKSLHFWINDFLMAIFFLVVGLEIKREIFEGALSQIRRAALPIAAAIGGMLVPALIYYAFNPSPPAAHGWGIPMATDIAFAVGVLALVGDRVPAGLRVLLLALAIIDDIGAILVIAIFYSPGIQWTGFLVAGTGLLLMLVLLRMGVRASLGLTISALVVWVGILQTGIHPTIAGVMVGLMAPVRAWYSREEFIEAAQDALDDFQDRAERGHRDHELISPLEQLAAARRAAIPAAVRVESALHPWVAYAIMPVFALANAGVHLSGIEFTDPAAFMVMVGVAVGLAAGKPLGIMTVSWLGVRLGLCALPEGVTWRGLFVVGSVAGIGFTMAIFIAELAFAGSPLLGGAKIAVLSATAIAAFLGLVSGRILLAREQSGSYAYITPGDAEASTQYWTGQIHVAQPRD